MCDYSLAGLPNRLAIEGEQLVVYRFPAGTLGLASPCPSLFGEEIPAVCIPPGARLRLRDIPRSLQLELDIDPLEEVTFVQLSAEAYEYRDAMRFRNDRDVLLQRLRCGQQVDVLSLASGGFQEEEHQRIAEEYCRIFVG